MAEDVVREIPPARVRMTARKGGEVRHALSVARTGAILSSTKDPDQAREFDGPTQDAVAVYYADAKTPYRVEFVDGSVSAAA